MNYKNILFFANASTSCRFCTTPFMLIQLSFFIFVVVIFQFGFEWNMTSWAVFFTLRHEICTSYSFYAHTQKRWFKQTKKLTNRGVSFDFPLWSFLNSHTIRFERNLFTCRFGLNSFAVFVFLASVVLSACMSFKALHSLLTKKKLNESLEFVAIIINVTSIRYIICVSSASAINWKKTNHFTEGNG